MQPSKSNVLTWLNSTNVRLTILFGVLLTALFFSADLYAKDLLEGTMGDVKDTVQGTGRKWIIIIDFAVSLGAFAMSKKPLVFFSVLAVSLALSALVVMIS